jgi:predicted Zn-ribbon and HTH transcriptional regulator
MKNGKDQAEVYYQCNTCQFVLKQRRTDPSPSYCPNCAIHHMKGTMILVEEKQRAKGSPG